MSTCFTLHLSPTSLRLFTSKWLNPASESREIITRTFLFTLPLPLPLALALERFGDLSRSRSRSRWRSLPYLSLSFSASCLFSVCFSCVFDTCNCVSLLCKGTCSSPWIATWQALESANCTNPYPCFMLTALTAPYCLKILHTSDIFNELTARLPIKSLEPGGKSRHSNSFEYLSESFLNSSNSYRSSVSIGCVMSGRLQNGLMGTRSWIWSFCLRTGLL